VIVTSILTSWETTARTVTDRRLPAAAAKEDGLSLRLRSFCSFLSFFVCPPQPQDDAAAAAAAAAHGPPTQGDVPPAGAAAPPLLLLLRVGRLDAIESPHVPSRSLRVVSDHPDDVVACRSRNSRSTRPVVPRKNSPPHHLPRSHRGHLEEEEEEEEEAPSSFSQRGPLRRSPLAVAPCVASVGLTPRRCRTSSSCSASRLGDHRRGHHAALFRTLAPPPLLSPADCML